MTRIIVRMPNWLGDAVMGTPILLDIRKAMPDAQITVMCKEPLGDLFHGNPAIDEIFTFKIPNTFYYKLEHRDLIARLKEGRYDIGILLPNSFTSAWWFFRGGVKRRIGFKSDGRSFLLTDRVPFPATRGKEHLVDTYKDLLSPLGIGRSDTPPTLFVSDDEKKAAETLLSEYRIPKDAELFGINPHAAYGPAKCWPPDRYRDLCKRLLQTPNRYLLFFGDNTAKELCASIVTELNSPRAINLAGATSLRLFLALLSKLTMFVTNDSGPMHLAAALKTPLVAIFGSTSEIATGPYHHGTVIHKHVSCSPCFKRVCPIDFRCMKQISVDEVYDTINRQLKKK